MIFNAQLEKNLVKTFDFCIIGSGVGASTLALELFDSHYSILLIEAGNFDSNSNQFIKKEIYGQKFGLEKTNSIEVGGTSNLWHGVLAPLDKIDFEKRSWIQNSGWPICYNELLPYYKRAANLLGLSKFDYFQKNNLSPKINKVLELMKFNKKILKNKIFQRPMPITQFKKILLKKLNNSQNCHLLYNTAALELVHGKSKKINELICGNNKGKKFVIKANKFIICAGALETPRLLLNSKINNKNIGKYLMDHPMGSTHQIKFQKKQNANLFNYFNESKNLMIKSGFTFTDDVQKESKIPNHCFYTKAAFFKGIDLNFDKVYLSYESIKKGKLSLKYFINILANLRLVISILAINLRLKTRYTDLFFITEQTPNSESKVTLSEKKDIFGYPIAKVNWRLSNNDILSVSKVLNILKTKVFKQDFIIEIKRASSNGWKKIYTSAAHHLGTARMSDSRLNGVVDKNLKVFEIENLFICDGSVFPTSGNANCALTISALSCRLADHLKNLNKK